MFKFNFARENNEEKQNGNDTWEKSELDWFTATKIEPADDDNFFKFAVSSYTEGNYFPKMEKKFKVIKTEEVVAALMKSENKNIIEAEKQHSDLVPAKYEGGLKIWECSYDLGNYLLDNGNTLENKRILDLGCGTGIVGLLALLKGAFVDFQDYNKEVIESVTIPNIYLNSENWPATKKKCQFYSGDWKSLAELYEKENNKYDVILTSETIYNPENQEKLFDIFRRCLKKDGIGLVAGKTYYFGVGGGMRQFENLVQTDESFNTEIAWNSKKGVQREILKLIRKNTTFDDPNTS